MIIWRKIYGFCKWKILFLKPRASEFLFRHLIFVPFSFWGFELLTKWEFKKVKSYFENLEVFFFFYLIHSLTVGWFLIHFVKIQLQSVHLTWKFWVWQWSFLLERLSKGIPIQLARIIILWGHFIKGETHLWRYHSLIWIVNLIIKQFNLPN